MRLSDSAKKALESPVNHRVALQIQRRRAVTVTELHEDLRVGWSSLKHAIDALRASGIVDAEEGFTPTLSIVPGVFVPPEPVPRTRRILVAREVLERPGQDAAQLAERLGEDRNKLLCEIIVLREAGLVISHEVDGPLTPTPKLQAYLAGVESL